MRFSSPGVGFVALALLGSTAACRSTKSSAIEADRPAVAVALAPAGDAAAAAASVSVDGGSPDALRQLADGNNAVGLDVYAAARRGHTNLALSPLSISMALTMAWAGARGDTAAEMKRVLHSELSAADALAAEARVLAWVRDPAQTVTLRVANRLFGEKTYSFEQSYLDATKTAFGAPLEPLDFVGAPGPSRQHINEWIAAQTEQHIKELIPARGITGTTRLVLTNAVYFLGHWDHPFKPSDTRPAAFHLSAKTSKDVPTMHESESLLFSHADGVKVLQVPYTGGQIAMVFVLPDAVDGLDAVEARLSSAALAAWTGALASTRVQVAIPKFKVEPGDPLALRGVLSSLGMPLAFDRLKADFTGIGRSPRPDERLSLGDVFHKAFVAVDEQGTEAAAATGVSVRQALVRREPPPEEFTADHPFLFFLRDVGSGTILFMGRVGDPSASPP